MAQFASFLFSLLQIAEFSRPKIVIVERCILNGGMRLAHCLNA